MSAIYVPEAQHSFVPLWERAEFIPCCLGDTQTPELERAMMPGLDNALREIARGVLKVQSNPSADADKMLKAS